MIKMIGAIIQLIMLIFSTILEKDKEKKAKKEQALKEMKDAIKDKDPSAVTSILDDLNNGL